MMRRTTSQRLWVALTIALIVVIDQAVKFYIKLNFTLGQTVDVFSWFKITFVENPGMAFGMQWVPKWVLTLLRVVLVGVLAWYMHRLSRRNGTRTSYLVVLALIVAGALGNIIDCLFYGILFGPSTAVDVATLLPATGGYASFGTGRVVDMLYFPIIHNAAGQVVFFSPVFNIADSAITIAVFALILFFRKDLDASLNTSDTKPTTK